MCYGKIVGLFVSIPDSHLVVKYIPGCGVKPDNSERLLEHEARIQTGMPIHTFMKPFTQTQAIKTNCKTNKRNDEIYGTTPNSLGFLWNR